MPTSWATLTREALIASGIDFNIEKNPDPDPGWTHTPAPIRLTMNLTTSRPLDSLDDSFHPLAADPGWPYEAAERRR